jgi:hypothetical protein
VPKEGKLSWNSSNQNAMVQGRVVSGRAVFTERGGRVEGVPEMFMAE